MVVKEWPVIPKRRQRSVYIAPQPTLSFLALFLIFLALIGGLSAVELGSPPPGSDNPNFPGITLELPAAAEVALQQAGQAFPAAAAGFSAYYRVANNGGYSLDKAAYAAP